MSTIRADNITNVDGSPIGLNLVNGHINILAGNPGLNTNGRRGTTSVTDVGVGEVAVNYTTTYQQPLVGICSTGNGNTTSYTQDDAKDHLNSCGFLRTNMFHCYSNDHDGNDLDDPQFWKMKACN